MPWPQRMVILRSFAVLLSVFLITSMYWIVPYVTSLFNGSGGPSTVLTVEVVNMLSSNSTPLNVIRGIGYWWPRVEITAQGILQPFWYIASYIVPVLAFGALIFRRDRLTIFLAGLAVFFIILSMGTNWVLGGFYTWLTFDAPWSGQVGWSLQGPRQVVRSADADLCIAHHVDHPGLDRPSQKEIFHRSGAEKGAVGR